MEPRASTTSFRRARVAPSSTKKLQVWKRIVNNFHSVSFHLFSSSLVCPVLNLYFFVNGIFCFRFESISGREEALPEFACCNVLLSVFELYRDQHRCVQVYRLCISVLNV